MAYEKKDNSGVLFKNDKKQKDSHPDYTGNALIDGREFWISAWLKTGKNGGKFFSFAFKPKDFAQTEQRGQSISQQAQATVRRPDPISTGRNVDMDDEIPF
jgi:hypothetical protein